MLKINGSQLIPECMIILAEAIGNPTPDSLTQKISTFKTNQLRRGKTLKSLSCAPSVTTQVIQMLTLKPPTDLCYRTDQSLALRQRPKMVTLVFLLK